MKGPYLFYILFDFKLFTTVVQFLKTINRWQIKIMEKIFIGASSSPRVFQNLGSTKRYSLGLLLLFDEG